MNPKKKSGTNKRSAVTAAVSLLLIFLPAGCAGIMTYALGRPATELIRNTVSTLLGGLILLFLWYRHSCLHTLAYENSRHQLRFFFVFALAFPASASMVFVPIEGWIFLSLMVFLSLLSNAFIGLAAGSLLLMVTVSLTPGAGISSFFLYFLLGLMGISLFDKLDLDFRVGEPLFLSALGSLVLQTAWLVIVESRPFSPDLLLYPALNVFVNLILLFFLLNYFANIDMFHTQDKYAEINDQEFPLMVKMKRENKEHYMEAVHRAYLGNRMASRLAINDKAVKGCCYYYKLAREEAGKEASFSALYDFPEDLRLLMEECMRGHYGSKESCVALTSDKVICRIREAQLQGGNAPIDYHGLVADIFDELMEGDCLADCDISIRELGMMKKVLAGESLYYDFLRG